MKSQTRNRHLKIKKIAQRRPEEYTVRDRYFMPEYEVVSRDGFKRVCQEITGQR
jgi:UDP-galactopyranose mutase